MLRYPVTVERDTNGTFLISCPDIPEVHTFGRNRNDALARALDAIETAFIGYMDDRRDIPKPSPVRKGAFVALPALTVAKIGLYATMRARRIGKAELARRLDCHLPQVDRMLDLRHASRLDQLEAAFRALGKELTVQVREAA